MSEQSTAMKAILEVSGEEVRQRPGPNPDPSIRIHPEDLALLLDEMASSVQAGIDKAMSKERLEQFWRTGMDVLHEKAAMSTGKLILSGTKKMASKAWWWAVLAVVLYTLGGWQFLVAVYRAYQQSKGNPT